MSSIDNYCPACNADPGERCVRMSGSKADEEYPSYFHTSRHGTSNLVSRDGRDALIHGLAELATKVEHERNKYKDMITRIAQICLELEGTSNDGV